MYGYQKPARDVVVTMALADLGWGGACQVHATPYGTQFFHFHIHFHQKVPASEVHASPMGARPPTGNPESATAWGILCLSAKTVV